MRIELAGFGCLSNYSADLAPGLNLFYGDNEAGKSTLQAAVCAMLYGFYDGDRARPEETARHERYRPWLGASYRGSLEYELNDGRRFEARREFSNGEVSTQLIDVTTGRDIAPEFGLGRHGNVPFARKHLGMTRTVFQGVAFISQGEVFQVADAAPRQIGDAIASLADSARRDVSAANAIARLDAALQKVGSDRARTAALPKAREKTAELSAELKALDTARQDVARQAAELDGIDDRLRTLSSEIQRTEYLWCRARAAELRRLLDQVHETESALVSARREAAALHGFAEFPANLRDQVVSLKARLERAGEAVERSRADLAAAAIPEDELVEFETLRSSVGSLSSEGVGALEHAAYLRPSPRSSWLGAVVRVLASGVLGLVRRLLHVFGRRAGPAGAKEAPPINPVEAQALLERHRRYLVLRPGVEALHRTERQFREDAAGVDAVETQLTAVVSSAGIATGSSVEQATAEYMTACAQHEKHRAAAARAGELERRMGILLAGRSVQEIEAALEDAEERMSGIVSDSAAHGGATSSESAERLSGRLATLRQQQQALEVKRGGLHAEVGLALSRHRSRAEVEEDLSQWREKVQELERSRAAIELAKAVIGEAMDSVYRHFAPAVNSFLSEGMRYITEDRYLSARVDPETLRISLLVPETGRVETDPPVSHGTRTVTYVLMRIGLAKHMSTIGEPVPLLLDDPFVDVDGRRLARALEFVERLSEETQVLLFTKDESVLNWFHSRHHETRHRLHQLNRPAFAAALL